MYPQYLPSIVAMFRERHVLFFVAAAWAVLALWAVTDGVRLLRQRAPPAR